MWRSLASLYLRMRNTRLSEMLCWLFEAFDVDLLLSKDSHTVLLLSSGHTPFSLDKPLDRTARHGHRSRTIQNRKGGTVYKCLH